MPHWRWHWVYKGTGGITLPKPLREGSDFSPVSSVLWPLRICSGFNPAAAYGPRTGACTLREPPQVEPCRCANADDKAAMPGALPLCCALLTLGLSGRPWFCLAHSPSFGLGHHPSPLGYLCAASLGPFPSLSTEACVSAPSLAHNSRQRSWAERCRSVTRATCVSSLCSACWKLAAELTSASLKLPLCPGWSPSYWQGFPGWRNVSPFTASSQGQRSCLDSLFSLFCPTWLYGDLSCSFDWMRSSIRVQQLFLENCSTCRCIFHAFVGGGELYVHLFCHFDLSSSILFCSELDLYFHFLNVIPVFAQRTQKVWILHVGGVNKSFIEKVALFRNKITQLGRISKIISLVPFSIDSLSEDINLHPWHQLTM